MTDNERSGSQATVDLPSGTVRVVDLSVLTSEYLPSSWPGSMIFAHKPWNWFAEVDIRNGQRYHSDTAGRCATNFLIMDEHTGTHLDGPTHWIPPVETGLDHASPLGALSGDKLNLTEMCGLADVLDMRSRQQDARPGISPYIRTTDLEAWESEHGLIDAPVVLFRTGWDQYYVEGPEGAAYIHDPVVTKRGFGWPAPDADAMLFLHERGVRLVGTDAPSMGACHDGAPVHYAGLENGMLFIELLFGLGELPKRGSWFQFLPIKVAGSTGGPGRAIAFVPVN